MSMWISKEDRIELLKKRRVSLMHELKKEGMFLDDIAFIFNIKNKGTVSRMMK